MQFIRCLSLSLLLSVTLRQFFWPIETQVIAWFIPVGASLAFFYISFFKNRRNLHGRNCFDPFRLIYILPLVFFFLLRVVWPDMSYDTSLYHVSLGIRSLLGYPHTSNDFFPNGAFLVSPITDMYMGFFRTVLGYRLGTIGNLFIYLWIALTVEKFLSKYNLSNFKRACFVLLIIASEFCIIEMKTYMVDIIPVALLLEATWLLYSFEKDDKKTLFFIPFLLGIGFACKFTGIFFVVPLGLWYLKILWENHLTAQILPAAILLFALPYMPILIFVYRETGNPLFPLFNNIFKSPLWPTSRFKAPRWGAENPLEYIFWSLLSVFKQSRLSELGHYSGRLSFSFIMALWLLCKRKQIFLSLLFFISTILWSYVGYIRYILFIEIIGGILIVFFILDNKKHKYISHAVLLLLIIQAGYAGFLSFKLDWAWRPKIAAFNSRYVPMEYMKNIKYLFHDHSARNFMMPADSNKLSDINKLVDNAEQWLLCDNWQPVANVAFLLKSSIPVISIAQRENAYIIASPEGKKRFENLMNRAKHNKTVAITSLFGGKECLTLLEKHGFKITGLYKVDLPVMARQYAFLEVQYIR